MRDRKRKRSWGGRRAGAGRKRAPYGKRRVAHCPRVAIGALTPLHVTVQLVPGLPSLRTPEKARILKKAFLAGRERPGFRVVHFAVMSNHIHMLVEADDNDAFSRGMRGLLTRIALNLNAALFRRGPVFADRFHSRPLRSTLDVWRTIHYVLANARRHGIAFSGALDPYSTAAWFNGWRDLEPATRPAPVAAPRSWQLKDGWWFHGRLDPWHVPRSLARDA